MAARYAEIADLPLAFAAVDPADAQEALDLVRPLVNPAVGGPCGLVTSEMHAYLAAHWLSLNPLTAGGGGGVALAGRRKIDKLEVEGPDESEFLLPFSLRRTKWGSLYLALCAAHCNPVLMVV